MASHDIVVRDLRVDEHPVARRLVAASFAGEAFAIGMFGERPLDRFLGMSAEYAAWPDVPDSVVLAIEAGGVLIGAALGTLPGSCHLCDGGDPTKDLPEPAGAPTAATQIEHEFQARCRAAHLAAGLPPHGHIQTVATEAFVRGAGLGRRLVDALAARLVEAGAPCVVLECLTAREHFYVGSGFERVGEFDDPGGPGLRSVMMRLDAG